MKLLLFLAILNSTVLGCAHYKMVGFDRAAGTVDIQCGKFGSAYEAQEKAAEYCHGPVKLVRYGETLGNISTQMQNGLIVTPKKNVYTFACLGE